MATRALETGPADDDVFARVSAKIEPSSLLEATPECLVVASRNGQIVYANDRVQGLTGFTREELVGGTIELLVTADILALPPDARVEALCRRRGGAEIPVEVNVGAIDAGDEPLLVVTLRDLSVLQAGREAQFEAEAKYRALVEHIPAVVYLDPVDEDGESIYVSPQIRDLIGIEPTEWLTDPYSWRHHVHPDDIDRAWVEYQDAYNNHSPLNHEYRMVHEDGTIRWVLEQAFPIDDEAGRPWLIQGVIFDITERKNAEEQVAFLAYHDKLTGLPNRVLFEEMLESSIARARRNDSAVGVLYLDLDNFKMVNDSLGHHSGDLLLAQLGDRLRTCTRDTDMVARQGGDEFLLLLSDLDRDESARENSALATAEMVAHRVREALAEPFDLQGVAFFASGSIGISLFPHDAQDAETLMKNADAAMYKTKRTEPGGFTVFTTHDMDPAHQFSLTSRLREAVREEHWVLHWQPIVDIETGHVESLEALIRWQDPKGGLVAPLEFIPLAEELGLIEAIGDWVITELVRQQAEWDAQGLQLRLGFNLSPRQLWSARLAEKIMAQMRGSDVDPRRVIVEITESTAMADPDRTQKILSELHSWGFTLALDDFGTGYSSLARLKHMPVDVLKIDKAFVHDVNNDISQASMVRAMIQLAQGLDMIPLAEGVETPQEYEFLRANGCRLAQGFLFSRPMPAADIPEVLSREGGLLPSTVAR